MSQAERLIEEAYFRIKHNPEGACWRLADALGSLSKKFPNASGIKYLTGLGNKIINIYDNPEKEIADEDL